MGSTRISHNLSQSTMITVRISKKKTGKARVLKGLEMGYSKIEHSGFSSVPIWFTGLSSSSTDRVWQTVS